LLCNFHLQGRENVSHQIKTNFQYLICLFRAYSLRWTMVHKFIMHVKPNTHVSIGHHKNDENTMLSIKSLLRHFNILGVHTTQVGYILCKIP